VTVTSSDTQEAIATDAITITVLDAEIAVVGITPAVTLEGQITSFTAEILNQADETVDYEWDFGDGSPLVSGTLNGTNLLTLAHVYAQPGVYTITLTVWDDDTEPVTH